MRAEEKTPAPVVIDANVLLAFYLPAEPYKAQALALLGDATAGLVKLMTPTLAQYEILNALSRAVRGLKKGQELSLEEAQEILTAMSALKLEERGVKGLEEHILKITQAHQRTAYDAAYLALAEREGVPLLTGDRRLYNAVKGKLQWVRWVGDYESVVEKESETKKG
jgi:predicted nucleic acid-binding protein